MTTAVGASMLASTRFPTAASVAFLQARGDGRATVPIMDTPHGIDAAFDLRFVEERTLIDVEQQHDRRYWTGRLGVTEECCGAR